MEKQQPKMPQKIKEKHLLRCLKYYKWHYKWHEIGFWYPECWANQEFVGRSETNIERNKNGDCCFYKEKRWWIKIF